MTIAREIPDPGPRRRYGSRPFPSYRYVPGVLPHPTRDAAGHSYEREPRLHRHPPWEPADWRAIDAWLEGVDLFNAHFFWEAHEAWEGLWAAKERDSREALFLQGLIQIAAALLKIHLQSPAGVRTLSTEGLDKLRRVASPHAAMMGLDLTTAIADFERYFVTSMPALGDAPQLRLEIEGKE